MIAFSLSMTIIIQLHITGSAHALQCYNCSSVADADECLTITECRAGQSCYMEFKASGLTSTLGCTDNQQCSVTENASGDLVGRALNRRQAPDCHECCSADTCNKNLCEHLKPGRCIDDVNVDCAWMNSSLNICKDVHHAKSICPKFCALCTLVVGYWGSWSPWSTCDVTCENGTQTRARTCSYPAPADGGLDCMGSSTDTKPCLNQLCPVHGGWTTWSDWDTCSTTCDVGIEKRHRNCSNPVPDRNGSPCFGDTLDARICLSAPYATPTIVFKAKNVTDTAPTAGQTMIFGTTLVNEGHAYSTSTGIFTAPVNGTYSFSTQFCVYPQKQLYIAILVDGITYATMYAYDQDSYPCNTAVTVAVLHAHSKVWVKCTHAYSGNIIYESSDRMNSFSGYLVHQ